MRAVVIFSDSDPHPFSPVLKRGYKHVYCAVLDARANSWVEYDWNSGEPILRVLASADHDIVAYYSGLRSTTEVLEIETGNDKTVLGLLLNNCVGHTKLICGISGWALTPYQLSKRLKQRIVHAEPSHTHTPRRQRIRKQASSASSSPGPASPAA